MKKEVFILGGAQTDFQRNWSKECKNFVAMIREVLEDSLIDTNIDYKEITKLKNENKIGIFVGNFAGEKYFNQGHLGSFFTEIDPVFNGISGARYEAACASGSVAIDSASAKIRAGDIDVAIVLGIELMKTVDPIQGGDFLGTAAYYDKEAKGISFPFPKLFGKLADSYVEKYSLDEKRYFDNLAEISTINYSNAKLNPNAQTRSWFMDKEQAIDRGSDNNPIVGGKLCITDCSQVTDGAAVVILASEKYYKEFKSKNRKIKISKISGWGCRVAPVTFLNKIEESVGNQYILPWTRQTVLDALERANLKENDINVYETHDCFTSSEYAAISAFGLTKPGREYEAIESGKIKLTGESPINPSGGLIGVGHPVGASGIRMLLDLHKQVTNQAGLYQVKKYENGMMLNIGGSATTNYVFIVSKN